MSANPVELENFIRMYGDIAKKRIASAETDENKENQAVVQVESKLPMPVINPQPVVTVNRAELDSSLSDTYNQLKTPVFDKTPKATGLKDLRQEAAQNIDEKQVDMLDTPGTKFAKEILLENQGTPKVQPKSTESLLKSTDTPAESNDAYDEFSFEASTPQQGVAKKGVSLSSRLSIDTADLLNSTSADLDETNAEQSQVVEEEISESSLLVNPTDSIRSEAKDPKTPNQADLKHLFTEKSHEAKTPSQV